MEGNSRERGGREGMWREEEKEVGIEYVTWIARMS